MTNPTLADPRNVRDDRLAIARHPLILPFGAAVPSFASPLASAGEGSAVLGRVTIGRAGRLGPLAVVRADGHYVQIGDDFELGARSTVHIAHDVFPCVIGDRVSVGADACVHACTVGNDVVIEDRVVILDGATVENNVLLEAGATVFPGKRIASGHVYAGSPAVPVRALSSDDIAERRRRLATAREAAGSPPPRSVATAGSSIDPTVFIASTASVRGRLEAATDSSIWFSNDFDAGDAVIRIGRHVNIQDNTVVRCITAQGVTIGPSSSVGHNVTLSDCVVGEGSLIGIGSVVAPGTVVGNRVLLAAGAHTEPGQVLESGWLYGRTPARKIAPLDAGKQQMIAFTIATYRQYARDYGASEKKLGL